MHQRRYISEKVAAMWSDCSWELVERKTQEQLAKETIPGVLFFGWWILWVTAILGYPLLLSLTLKAV